MFFRERSDKDYSLKGFLPNILSFILLIGIPILMAVYEDFVKRHQMEIAISLTCFFIMIYGRILFITFKKASLKFFIVSTAASICSAFLVSTIAPDLGPYFQLIFACWFIIPVHLTISTFYPTKIEETNEESSSPKSPVLGDLEKMPDQASVLQYGSQHPEHTTHVLTWLFEHGDEEASQWLMDLYPKSSTSVRLDVLKVLARCGAPSIIPTLEKQREDARSPAVIESINTVLQMLQLKNGTADTGTT